MNDYPPPLDRLLRLGEFELGTEPVDYTSLGIGPEHVPSLVLMATDGELVEKADEEGEDDSLAWACEHALLALGQLGAVDAVDGVLRRIDKIVDVHDFWVESLAAVLEKLGPGTLPAIERYVEDREHDPLHRMIPTEGLTKIGRRYPEARDRLVSFCSRMLEREPADDPGLLGFLLIPLLDLKATEVAPVIEAAFEADKIDPTIAGDWPLVRHKLGLGPAPPPRRYNFPLPASRPTDAPRPDFKKLKKVRKNQAKKRKR